MKLLRPKLSIGLKTIIALTIVFWIPVISLITALYFSFNSSLFMEEFDTVKTHLKGARVIYEERSKNIKSLLEHIASQPEIKEIFHNSEGEKLRNVLLEFGKKNTHAEILIAVNENQKVLSRRSGRTGGIIILGDALSRSLMTGETIITTELVTHEFLSLEEEGLANRTRDIGIVQFVISPVRYGDKISGAIVAGILLSGESWLGNNVHNRFGAEIALFAGETFESFYLHSTASLPRNTWVMGQPIPSGLKEKISLGKPYYGDLEIDNLKHITAFELLSDSRNRVIGAIGVSKPAKNITLIVAMTIGKSLVIVATGALIVAMIITMIIYLDITRPLSSLVKAMRSFENGEMNTAITLETGDEFEKLGKCFNTMAESVRRRENRLKKHYQVAKLLMSTINLEELTDKILNVVIDVTGSQLGILYIYNEESQELSPIVHYGCRTDLPALKMGEGFPGRVLVDGNSIIVNGPETESGEMIEMGFSQSLPEEIAYIPLIFNNTNMGVLVIGRLKRYSRDEKELFTYLGNQISIALDNSILHSRIQELSISDHLTDLFNRRYLTMRLEEEWARCKRQNEPLSVILADLDDFKSVNDTYGHDRGDEVLKTVGKILGKLVRTEDVVARYGGEEFVVVFTNMSSAEAAIKADEMREAVKNFTYSWTSESITMSIGVATYPEIRVDSKEALLQTADKAMYKAKTDGKDKVVVCN